MLGSVLSWGLAAAFVLVALIGFLFVTRGTSVQHVRGAGGRADVLAPDDPEFARGVALLTGATLVPGTRVELALDGDGTFERLWADLRSARSLITLQMYYMGPGRVADTLAALLADRARAGVTVCFLYDAFGASALDRAYFDVLRGAGVRAVPFRPLRLRTLWVAQNRSHVRGVVIDGRVGWTGGFGFDDKWLGDGRTPSPGARDGWRETNVRFEGPAVLQLQAAFAAAWAEATGDLLTGRVVEARVHADGADAAGLLHTAPTLGSTPAERLLALTIACARRSLYVTNAYFAPDRHFVALLVDAVRRGVDVRILVGGPSTDVRAARAAARARYERLLAAGARVWEYERTTLHAKTFVVDGRWAGVGTMNFDNRSLALNDEVTLLTLDGTAGARLEALFLADLAHAVEITLPAFRRRPWTERVAERAADLLTRVL